MSQDTESENNTVEKVTMVSCNKCKQIYNKAQFNACPICGCAQYKEVEGYTDESTPFDSIQGYKVIPAKTEEQREVYLQYQCLNKACNGKFWSDTETKWCTWCKSKLIELTGEKKCYD